jgi:acyl carrier protein
MNIQKFTKLFAEQFEDSDEVNFESTTEFKQLDEWSSIMSLLIITMVKDNYNAVINAEDIDNSTIIKDLYNVVLAQQ